MVSSPLALSTPYVSAEEAAAAVAWAVVGSVLAGTLASVCAPRGTAVWKHRFSQLALIALVAVEFYYVGLVAIKLPPGTSVVLSACRESGKGGKDGGSFRDCSQGQGASCTEEQPCTPCDMPVGATEFDHLLWPNECRVCRPPQDPGLCLARNSSRSGKLWCTSASGNVEPCTRCCLDLGVDAATGERILSPTHYAEDDCAKVFGAAALGAWAADARLGCAHPDFPVKTAFGCCPAASLPRADAPSVAFGSGPAEQPACSLTGPNGASWALCQHESTTVTSNRSGAQAEVPAGCRIYSNGVFTGESYCRPPSFVEGGAGNATR